MGAHVTVSSTDRPRSRHPAERRVTPANDAAESIITVVELAYNAIRTARGGVRWHQKDDR